MAKYVLRIFFVFFAFLPAVTIASDKFVKKKIKLNDKILIVEVAQTLAQHEIGLMFRDKLDENEGMLFIFKNEEIRFFWMKNTFVDLAIAYFDNNGKLVDIQEMKSGKNTPEYALPTYPSARPAKYALEMGKGWFDRNKIKLGSKLKVY